MSTVDTGERPAVANLCDHGRDPAKCRLPSSGPGERACPLPTWPSAREQIADVIRPYVPPVHLAVVVDAVLAAVKPPTFPLARRWPLEQPVEYVGRRGAPNRPGRVVAHEQVLTIHEHLIVAFDDGETRGINPDVMRRIR